MALSATFSAVTLMYRILGNRKWCGWGAEPTGDLLLSCSQRIQERDRRDARAFPFASGNSARRDRVAMGGCLHADFCTPTSCTQALASSSRAFYIHELPVRVQRNMNEPILGLDPWDWLLTQPPAGASAKTMKAGGNREADID